MARVYVIPGLAADARTFGDFSVPGHEVVPLKWVRPERHESMAQYALKLRDQIQEDEPFSLLGVSFGGMLMIELAKISQPVHTFLVSSLETWQEVPGYYRWIGFLPHLLPYPIWKWLMVRSRSKDATVAPEFLEQLLTMIRESEGRLFRWSTSAVLRWRNEEVPKSLTHVHGTSDSLLPPRFVEPDIWVEGGQHYLINTHGEFVGQLIADTLAKSTSEGVSSS